VPLTVARFCEWRKDEKNKTKIIDFVNMYRFERCTGNSFKKNAVFPVRKNGDYLGFPGFISPFPYAGIIQIRFEGCFLSPAIAGHPHGHS
jgi:hypothetical protein